MLLFIFLQQSFLRYLCGVSPSAGSGPSLLCTHFSPMRIKIACKSSNMAQCQKFCSKIWRGRCAVVFVCVFYLSQWNLNLLRAEIVSYSFFVPSTKNNILHKIYAKYSRWAEWFCSVGSESSFKESLQIGWSMMVTVEQWKDLQSTYHKHIPFFFNTLSFNNLYKQ